MIGFAAGICLLAAAALRAPCGGARGLRAREATAARDAAELSRAAMAAVLGTLPVAGVSAGGARLPKKSRWAACRAAARTSRMRVFLPASRLQTRPRIAAAVEELRGPARRSRSSVSRARRRDLRDRGAPDRRAATA